MSYHIICDNYNVIEVKCDKFEYKLFLWWFLINISFSAKISLKFFLSFAEKFKISLKPTFITQL